MAAERYQMLSNKVVFSTAQHLVFSKEFTRLLSNNLAYDAENTPSHTTPMYKGS